MRAIPIFIAAVLAYAVYTTISNLRKNIEKAKKTGLPYIVAPCSPIFLPWQVTHKLWLPIIKLFPKPWWEHWLEPLVPNFTYRTGHEGFARYGDVVLVVSPAKLYALVSNAEAISQIASRREHFPKPTETYEILSQFGDNVLTTEGSMWRMHRKVTSATFNEKNAALVWKESIRQAQGMLRQWTGRGTSTIHTIDHDTMRLALNIISYVGFGLELLWPGESLPEGVSPKLAKYGSLEPPPGHKLSFAETVETLLENIFLLLLVPRWLLRLIPTKKTKSAAVSGEDWDKYMRELMHDKMEETRRGERVEGMDLMGQLVRSSYGKRELNGEVDDAMEKSINLKTGTLSRSEILGNAFIMLVAGHETTANAMHFLVIELATNPASQRRLHKDIDEILGGKDPSEWDYDSLLNPMTASMLGACMNETLRLMPAVVEQPRKVSPTQDQVITIDGKRHTLPRNTLISLAAISVHQNPRYWPARPSKIHPGKDDIPDWVPERWFRQNEDHNKESGKGEESAPETDYFGGYAGPDTSAQLFHPERGAYIPFSDGPRSCLGRRIAQVEVIVALAVLFREHSIELAVDEWASDEEVAAMSREKKAELYKTAQDTCRAKVRRAGSVLTLKLKEGEHIPVRLVKRGEERFVSWIGE